MKKIENRDDRVLDHDDGVVDLGAASALTQGAPGLVQEFENRIPFTGLAD